MYVIDYCTLFHRNISCLSRCHSVTGLYLLLLPKLNPKYYTALTKFTVMMTYWLTCVCFHILEIQYYMDGSGCLKLNCWYLSQTILYAVIDCLIFY